MRFQRGHPQCLYINPSIHVVIKWKVANTSKVSGENYRQSSNTISRDRSTPKYKVIYEHFLHILDDFSSYKQRIHSRQVHIYLIVQAEKCISDNCKKETTYCMAYLVSPVSFLKANPNNAIFLSVTVLNRQLMILFAKRLRWYSFIATTWYQ